MRVIVISDTHRDFRTLRRIVEKHREEAALFLHLGDGEREVDEILALYPDLPIEMVRGNCDFASMLPDTKAVFAGNVKIFMTHGHTLGVKGSLSHLVSAPRENGGRLAPSRHTPKGEPHYDEGLSVITPGSPAAPRDGRASYGVIDITEGGIFPFLVEI